MALSTAPAQGMGPNYHHLHGLSQPNLLHCTEAEARKLAAVDDLLEALHELEIAASFAAIDDVSERAAVDIALGYARAAIAKATGGCT